MITATGTTGLIISITTQIDPARPELLEQGHAALDGAWAAVEASISQAAADAAAGAPALRTLDPLALGQALTQLAGGYRCAPLNDGERKMLRAIAERSPTSATYNELRDLLGSGAKFGNVSSGLARRFGTRGWELPYAEDAATEGYRMPHEIARTVLGVLDLDPETLASMGERLNKAEGWEAEADESGRDR
jgi:hypothetical protein